MGFFDRFKKKEKKEDLMPLYLYDEKDLNDGFRLVLRPDDGSPTADLA